MDHVATLRARGIPIAVTVHNAFELRGLLIRQLAFTTIEADHEVDRVLAPFALVPAEDYAFRHQEADARLRTGGKSDWPSLAAALALDGHIWSEDVDYFGVGVPVWTTDNLPHLKPEVFDA